MTNLEIWTSTPEGMIVVGVPVLLWLAALLCAAVAIWWAPRPLTLGVVADKLVRYLLIFPLGLQSLWAFASHVFFAEFTANSIGSEPSPFQFEVGVANLGIGLAALYAAFRGFPARAAVAVAAACFLGGAGVGHLLDITQGDNLAPGNAGPILYADFLTPITLLVFLLMSPRTRAVPELRTTPKPERSLMSRLENIDSAPSRGVHLDEEIETARKSMRDTLTRGGSGEIRTPQKAQAGTPKHRRGPRKTPSDQTRH